MSRDVVCCTAISTATVCAHRRASQREKDRDPRANSGGSHHQPPWRTHRVTLLGGCGCLVDVHGAPRSDLTDVISIVLAQEPPSCTHVQFSTVSME
ncbi:hypothetical protein DMENIID0001_167260 [Sergentomyia squamirostris]